MRLSGRPQVYPARRERNIAKRARGAPTTTDHGPLQPMVRGQLCSLRLRRDPKGDRNNNKDDNEKYLTRGKLCRFFYHRSQFNKNVIGRTVVRLVLNVEAHLVFRKSLTWIGATAGVAATNAVGTDPGVS